MFPVSGADINSKLKWKHDCKKQWIVHIIFHLIIFLSFFFHSCVLQAWIFETRLQQLVQERMKLIYKWTFSISLYSMIYTDMERMKLIYKWTFSISLYSMIYTDMIFTRNISHVTPEVLSYKDLYSCEIYKPISWFYIITKPLFWSVSW